MKLFEVFNTAVDYQWVQGMDPGHQAAEFKVNGTTYHINFLDTNYQVDQVNKACTDISFVMFLDHGEMVDHMTGTGGAFQVMATVIEIMDEFLDIHYKVDALSFSAREPSRQRLYTRLIKRLQQEGWKITPHDDENKGDAKNWVLTR